MSERPPLPDSLRSSAVPRWSHRDPVECGNPFEPDDDRHRAWHAATERARNALACIDAGLELEPLSQHPDPYTVRVVALAVARFDIWSQRGLAAVRSPPELRDYEQWLENYTENWLAYVADTCPQIEVSTELRARLRARSRFWINDALHAVSAHGRRSG